MRRLAILLLPLAVIALPAQAQVKPDDAIRYRQSAFQVLVWNWAPMGAMVRGRTPFDAKAFAQGATRVQQISTMLLEGFPAGTEKGSLPSAAKPEIWRNQADFEKKMKDFGAAAAQLATLAGSGDEAAMKAQFAKTSETCKACHDRYKAD
jgi:cytochrome c556